MQKYTIHDTKNNDSYVLILHASAASRGGSEVALCLIKTMISKAVCEPDSVVIWSDNCAGPKKMVLFVMKYMILRTNFVK